MAFARHLADGPRMAIGEIKIAAKAGLETSLESGLALEREAIGHLFATADAEEGMLAFVEKRQPTWRHD